MKLKRTIITATTCLMLGACLISVKASETVSPVPVLISVQEEEVRGVFVSYEEGLLTVTVNEARVMVTVAHEGLTEEVKEVTESTYGAQLAKLQAGTLIDMMVSVGQDETYSLERLIAIHQVYNSGGEVPMLINAPTMNEQFGGGFQVTYGEVLIGLDVMPQVIDGKVMVPLRAIAEGLGYEVAWKRETQSVDLMKGPQFTSVYIANNAYFKNKMAARPLSAPPVIVDGRTLVPVEFVTEILGYGVSFDEATMKIYDEAFTTLTGYVSLIEVLDDYSKVYVAPRLGDDVALWEETVLIVSDKTVINRDMYKLGDWIQGVHMPAMTMSIPGQTAAVIIY